MRGDGMKGLMAKAPLLPVPSFFRLSFDGFVKDPLSNGYESLVFFD